MTFARNESVSEAANILIGFAGMRMPVYLLSVFFGGRCEWRRCDCR